MRGIRYVGLLGTLFLSLAAITIGAQTQAVFADAPQVYVVQLSGANEVPPRDTDAHGNAVFRVNSQETVITFNLHTTNLSGAFTGAHIHRGARGSNGPIVVHLTTSCTERNNSVHCMGEITDPTAVSTVLGMIEDGVAYVNVHSTVYPGGEVRGQIE